MPDELWLLLVLANKAIPAILVPMQPAPSLYLASQSPRRRRMMQWLGIPVIVTHVDIDETPRPGEPPIALAARLAREKAQAAAKLLAAEQPRPAERRPTTVLTADTVVDLDGVSLGKPADAAEAREMLARLRDRTHQVHTGVALAWLDGESAVRVRRVTTDVTMRAYTDAEIEAYIATGDPMDKAGAYAIQHDGFDPVARFETCYANVVGLPLGAVVALLEEAGWHLDLDLPALCAQHFGYACDPPDRGVVIQ